MKLKTSFFNTTALKKDITRFAPLWGLYTVFSLLYLILLWQDSFYNTTETMAMMGVVNLVYGGLCASLLFGDLFNARLCNALHAMPMRREGWFFTHLAAGLFFGIAPNLLGAVLAAFLLEEVSFVAFLWLAVAVLEFVFFFGVGVFAVMCAGNRLGMAAIYGLINFFAILLAWLVETFYAPVLPGVILDTSPLAKLCPTVMLSVSEFVEVSFDTFQVMTLRGFVAADWWYLLAVFGAGIVFLALALVIYRTRSLETAGDFISLKPAAPVFLVIFMLCVGAVLYLIAEVFNTELEYLFLLVGMAVGFFTGKMLIERKVKVFQKRNLLFFGVLVVSFWATIFVTWLDPVGVTRYVPEAKQVSSVTITPYNTNDNSLFSVSYIGSDMRRGGLTLKDQEDIENILAVHDYCIENQVDERESYMPLTISYQLKSGAQVQRFYHVSASSEAGKALKPYYSSVAYVLGTEDVGDFLSRINFVEFYSHRDPYYSITLNAWRAETGTREEENGVTYNFAGSLATQDMAKGLFAAIEKDCQEGTLTQLWDYHESSLNSSPVGSFSIEYRDNFGDFQYMDITVYEESTHTTWYLKTLQLK